VVADLPALRALGAVRRGDGGLVWDRRPAWQIDAVSGALTQLTFTPTFKSYVLKIWSGMRNTWVIGVGEGDREQEPTRMVFYEELPGQGWVPFHTISPPPGYPVFSAPELFTWQGRTWLLYNASRAFDGGEQWAEGTLWLSAVDPSLRLHRQLGGPNPRIRQDAEPYVGGNELLVYYTIHAARGGVVTRVTSAGLLP
jgi:hypothetical protein